jgi:hypothetical protein
MEPTIPTPPPGHRMGPGGEYEFDPDCWMCQAHHESPARRRLWAWRLRWWRR